MRLLWIFVMVANDSRGCQFHFSLVQALFLHLYRQKPPNSVLFIWDLWRPNSAIGRRICLIGCSRKWAKTVSRENVERHLQRSPEDRRHAGALECAGRAQRRRRFADLESRAERAKAGSRFACPRTPRRLAPRPNVAHPTAPSVSACRTAHQISGVIIRHSLFYWAVGNTQRKRLKSGGPALVVAPDRRSLSTLLQFAGFAPASLTNFDSGTITVFHPPVTSCCATLALKLTPRGSHSASAKVIVIPFVSKPPLQSHASEAPGGP